MARQAVPRSSKSKRETPARPVFARPRLSWGGREWQVAGVLIVVLAILTAVALARLAPGILSDGWADLLIARHPHLAKFVRAQSSALVCVEVVRYFHVCRFQEVRQWVPGSAT